MGYWKSKLLPKIKKVFDKGSSKKAAAAEATKAFDDSKVGIFSCEKVVLCVYFLVISTHFLCCAGRDNQGV